MMAFIVLVMAKHTTSRYHHEIQPIYNSNLLENASLMKC